MRGMMDFGMVEDWFNQGKEDAWSGRSKQPPTGDPVAASLYDLGYSEGTYRKPPNKVEPFHHA
jgi:hypothetical protein